jgi:hypothetical protein
MRWTLDQLVAIARRTDTARLDLTPLSARLFAISLGCRPAAPMTMKCLRVG